MTALLSLLITALEAERNQSVLALRQQERELRTLADNLPDVIIRLDRELKIVFVNQAITNALGLPPAHFLGRMPLEAGLPVGSIPDLTNRLLQVLATGQAQTLVFEFAGPGGTRHWTTQLVPELQEGATVRSVLIIARDITEQHQLEHQLRQSQKLEAVGTLAGGIAHDFNNILTGISGNTQLAMMDLAQDNPVQEELQRVMQASERARALVNKILAFSRRQEQQRTPLHLEAIAQEAMQLLRPSIRSSIAIRVQVPPASSPVLADAGQLHQVLLNLVTNAVHAIGDREGQIEIRVDELEIDAEAVRQRPQLRCGHFVRLAVSDDGDGMDAVTLARIFEPFFTTKKTGAGTGLGLSVVHGIVQQHEGCMVVYSEPAKGSTFLVYLPVAKSKPGASLASKAPDLVRGQGEQIMLVDDEAIVLEVAGGILQRLGYTTTAFNEPEAALRAFTEQPMKFDLVVTDLTMPKLTGTELADRLHQLRPALPVILCTGFSGALDAGARGQPGLYGPLLKPFTLETLARVVADTLRQSRTASDRAAPGC
jgi:PAS domain S-box-containing protein